VQGFQPIKTKWIACSLAARLATFVGQILCIRAVIGAFGTAQYAYYASLSGLLSWYFLLDFGIGYVYAQRIVQCEGDRQRIEKTQALFDTLLFRVCTVSLVCALCFGFLIYHLWRPWQGLTDGNLALGLVITSVLGCIMGLLNARARMTVCLGNALRLQVVLAASWLVVAIALAGGTSLFREKWSIAGAVLVAMLGQTLALFIATGAWRRDPSFGLEQSREWLAKNAREIRNGLGFAFFSACYIQVDSILIPELCTTDQVAKYNLLMKLALGWHVCYIQLLQYIQGHITQRNSAGVRHVTFGEAGRVIAFGIAASAAVTFGLGLLWTQMARFLKVNGVIAYGIGDAVALLLYLSSRCALDYLNVLIQTVGDLGAVRKVALLQAIVTGPIIILCARGGASPAIAGFGMAIWVVGVAPLFALARKSGALRPAHG
jgi:type IV secretory pathway TrbD component